MVKQHKHEANLYWAFIILFLAAFIYTQGVGSSITGMQIANVPNAPQVQVIGEQVTPLDGAVQFLKDFGFFNVVLPFLLIFAIVFGILEKTKIFGTEKSGDDDVPRRNLNSVVAFCIAFFVIAASNVVGILQASIPAIALVLVIVIVILLLFGSLMGHEKLEKGLHLWDEGWGKLFAVILFIAVIAIFLGVVGALDIVLGYIGENMGGTFITGLVFLIVIVLALWFVTKGSNKGDKN